MVDEMKIRNEIRESLQYRCTENHLSVVSIVETIRKSLPDENNDCVIKVNYKDPSCNKQLQNYGELTKIYRFGKKINIKLMRLPYYNKLFYPAINYIKNNIAGSFKYKTGIHYIDLMGGNTNEFLNNAYLTLLNRVPDENGLSSYADFLYKNRNDRILVLGSIRYSREGKQHAVQVKGLRSKYLLRKTYKMFTSIPVIGYFFKFIKDMITLSKKFDQLFYTQNFQTENMQMFLDEKDVFQNKMNDADIKLQQCETVINEYMDKLLHQEEEIYQLKSHVEVCFNHIEQQYRVAFNGYQDRLLYQEKEICQLENRLEECANLINQQNNWNAEIERKIMIYLESQENIKRCEEERKKFHEDMYLAFEDKFRGSQALIKERLVKYLSIVENVDLKNHHDYTNVLDIGCGRGEWLELLKENRFRYLGIDSNKTMIAACEEKKLKAQCVDALDYLNTQSNESYYVITGFQVVEHLEPEQLTSLLQETYRVLKHGGVAIFETPNPENLIIGACNFYFDPTHNKPIPPERLRFLAEYVGFEKVEIIRSNPYNAIDTQNAGEHNEEFMKLAQFFNNMSDYAIVAYKE